jgi:hypothetical protein
MEILLGQMQCGNAHRASQALTEATVAKIGEMLPAIHRSAIQWFCESKGIEYDGSVPPEDYTPLPAAHREMLKEVLGSVAL